jgi:hypothetical protein
MNRLVLSASFAALVLLIPSLASPEAKTDFSGKWDMDTTRSESAHSTPPSGPVTLGITQSDTELIVETTRNGQTETIAYKLDGSETKKPAQDNGPFQWSAKWDGPTLITETHRNINRTTITIKEALSLDSTSKELTVDRTLTVQHGYQMRGGKNYSSGRDVFVKAK